MLKYMGFVESLIKNLSLFQQELSNCIDTPSAQEKVKSVLCMIHMISVGGGNQHSSIAQWLKHLSEEHKVWCSGPQFSNNILLVTFQSND